MVINIYFDLLLDEDEKNSIFKFFNLVSSKKINKQQNTIEIPNDHENQKSKNNFFIKKLLSRISL